MEITLMVSHTLSDHPFCQSVLQEGADVEREVYPKGSVLDIDPEPIRPLTEVEFYRVRCGYSVAHLLALVEQIERFPAYLRGYGRSERMRAEGVTRVSDLIYHWENYVVRCRSLEDRALQLVSAALHLGINPRDIRFHLVLRNAHVRTSTTLPAILKRLHQLVQPVVSERNRIVHERGLLDQQFRKIEFWQLVGQMLPDQKDVAVGNYMTTIRQTVPQRVQEVQELLETSRSVLHDLFDDLLPRYESLITRLGHQ